MIVISSVPKAGSHKLGALLNRMGAKRCPGTILGCTRDQAPHVEGAAISLATLRLLPDTLFIIAHVAACHAEVLEGCPVVSVLRHPANVLVSYQRHRKRVDGIEITTEEAIRNYWGAPFFEVYRGFLGWRGQAAMVRFEEIPDTVAGSGNGIYPPATTFYNTRTGRASNYRKDWGGEDWAAWWAAGGPELAAEAGY